MKYGLLVYEENKRNFNVGDYVQSLAAKQFLPKVDVFLNREKLSEYKGEKVKLIMNGWFTHNPNNWIPSDDIIPLFISFHINSTAAKGILNEKGIAYLKKYEPIGCRDQYTAELLASKGVKSYFSGCLTLTLDSYKCKESERNENIYIVDPLYNYPTIDKVFYDYKTFLRSIINGNFLKVGKRRKHLKIFIDNCLLKSAFFENQVLPSGKFNNLEKFSVAEDLLKKYAKAKLIVTSRIHCALPCLALGTPVIFVNGFDDFMDSCRLNGIYDLFNYINIDSNTGEYETNFIFDGKISKKTVVENLNKHETLADALKSSCTKFIKS